MAASRELLLRIATALVMAPLVLAALLALPTPWFAAFLLPFIAVGAWEWASLSRLAGPVRVLFLAAVAGVVTALWYVEAIRMPALWAAALWWLAALALVVAYPRASGVLRWRGFNAMVGVVTLACAWIALVEVHGVRPMLVLWLLLQVWGADIGAYFAGRTLGKHKLAPRVSPGKTWEGLGGGLALALLVAATWGILDPDLVARWHGYETLLAVSGFIVLVSVVGDLAESLQKRMAQVKDSGRLFPGHGGVLDRIDSLLAAAPIFALVLFLLD